MKFIDEAKILVKAGDGGQGCVSFRREKFIPHGGPDGGNGGRGGDIILITSRSHSTLLDMKYRQHHTAKRGGHGSGNNRTGKDAIDIVLVVPMGTLVKDDATGEILADLTEEGQRFIVAKGGIGGKGNAWFTSSTYQAPHFAQEGMPGDERWVKLELKLLADVGIIGFPNVGKSSFIARVSAARPKIADYPFTTLTPNLGVVKYGNLESFVIADIPGLIEGAHQGLGRGIKFLRHVERTKVLLHIIDIADGDCPGAWENYLTINGELEKFSADMMEKPQIVAINKIDLPDTREKLEIELARLEKNGIRAYPFSAATGEGTRDILNEMIRLLGR
ncbi:MAG: GTPase ObgE [Deltaproteobacteria bacterium]|nr:GTPase ObgE [Deltaproteobacteria bacterium]